MRRVELGYRHRPAFADALGVSTRVLGDVETGRRGNFDSTTLAALENVLGWATGSVDRIVAGGEPVLTSRVPRPVTVSSKVRFGATNVVANDTASGVGVQHCGGGGSVFIHDHTEGNTEGDDQALVRVMRSNLPDSKKRQLVRLLIAEREALERQRLERADELIRLLKDETTE